ncbi:DUF4365 domain-containing protein [Burkholderia stabilis]|nr:DUF4365 domain-containing protein [Burkholderia stabilis]
MNSLSKKHMVKRTKDSNGNTLPPKRSDEHRIDSEAVKVVRNLLTADWEERSVEGRDYGIDMMVEAFDGDDPTGTLVLFQIKGLQASFGSEGVSLSVPVKTLLYARMFQAPFFLVHASVADKRAYFVWLQKYINSRLTFENPRWIRQGKVTIHFPLDNELNKDGLAKIRSLSTYVAHRDLGIAFLGHLIILQDRLKDFHATGERGALAEAISRTKEIAKLESFFNMYEETCPDVYVDFEDMLIALKKAESYGEFDFGDDDMVESQVTNLLAIARMFLSQDEGDAFVAENMETNLPY